MLVKVTWLQVRESRCWGNLRKPQGLITFRNISCLETQDASKTPNRPDQTYTTCWYMLGHAFWQPLGRTETSESAESVTVMRPSHIKQVSASPKEHEFKTKHNQTNFCASQSGRAVVCLNAQQIPRPPFILVIPSKNCTHISHPNPCEWVSESATTLSLSHSFKFCC